jgi:Family of unknown function (DUF6312)
MTLDQNQNEKAGPTPKGAQAVVEESAPIVVRPKKKKKYSRNLRTIQELETGLTDSARRIAKAAKDGLDAYIDERDKSAKNRRDGAIRDLLRNQSKGLRKALSVAAEVPADIMDTIADLKVVRRLTK